MVLNVCRDMDELHHRLAPTPLPTCLNIVYKGVSPILLSSTRMEATRCGKNRIITPGTAAAFGLNVDLKRSGPC